MFFYGFDLSSVFMTLPPGRTINGFNMTHPSKMPTFGPQSNFKPNTKIQVGLTYISHYLSTYPLLNYLSIYLSSYLSILVQQHPDTNIRPENNINGTGLYPDGCLYKRSGSWTYIYRLIEKSCKKSNSDFNDAPSKQYYMLKYYHEYVPMKCLSIGSF